jgi:phosphoribosylformylglycinamidine cyclo-ligase
MPRPAKSDRDEKCQSTESLSYSNAGVDIDRGDQFVGRILNSLRSTHGPRVIQNPGGFAGLFRLDYNEQLFQRNYTDPVLVACADGVGTKIKIAGAMEIYDTIGIDLVAMNVNDLVVQGAEPLFFLDYIAAHKLHPERLGNIVQGIANACATCRCALLGGETAEMPSVYPAGEIDLAGFAVGVVELKKVTNPVRVQPGDIVLGLGSDGVHSNGFSLVHAILQRAKLDLDNQYAQLGTDVTLGQALLQPTRLYAPSIVQLLGSYKVKRVVSGMAHITGGGLADNLSRALPEGVDAVIRKNTWEVPALFRLLQEQGNVEEDEMWRVFNMGIGYCVIVRPLFADAVTDKLRAAGERVFRIGKITKGKGQVRYR